MYSYPVFARFTHWKQYGGLVLPSPEVLRILKAKEVIFKWRVINTERGITVDRMIDLKIESAVVQQIGNRVFNNVDGHYFEHEIGQEMDHLSSLLRTVVQRYIKLRLKTYGKMYTMRIVHQNLPSIRHQLNKTILFRNQ